MIDIDFHVYVYMLATAVYMPLDVESAQISNLFVMRWYAICFSTMDNASIVLMFLCFLLSWIINVTVIVYLLREKLFDVLAWQISIILVYWLYISVRFGSFKYLSNTKVTDCYKHCEYPVVGTIYVNANAADLVKMPYNIVIHLHIHWTEHGWHWCCRIAVVSLRTNQHFIL